MFKCEYCNAAEFETEKQLKGHQIACRKKRHVAEKVEIETPIDMNACVIIEPYQEPEVASIPLSVCPKEITYLRKGQQLFLQVAGRIVGDRFVVESTKVVR